MFCALKHLWVKQNTLDNDMDMRSFLITDKEPSVNLSGDVKACPFAPISQKRDCSKHCAKILNTGYVALRCPCLRAVEAHMRPQY